MEVNGKVGFWGRTKLGIVLKSGVCEYIIPTEQTDKKCTVETQRKGWPKPVSITYTLEQAEKAGLLARSDAWKKHPSDMLYWRAVSRIISQVYPDVIQGFATVEEEEENPTPKAQVVAMPEEVEMPKPKRVRKVKAVVAEESSVVEEKEESTILPPAEEMKTYDIKLEEAHAESAKDEEALFELPEEVAPAKKPLASEPKRYVRFIKQVMLEGGERYLIAKNPIVNQEDKWRIPTAGMAGELKKLTGMKAYIFSDGESVYGYEEYPEQN
jgi:hypothetical protein